MAGKHAAVAGIIGLAVGSLFGGATEHHRTPPSTTEQAAPHGGASGDAAGTPLAVRPFEMPVEGAKWQLFQPIYDMDKAALGVPLLAPREVHIANYMQRVQWLRSVLTDSRGEDLSGRHLGDHPRTAEELGRLQYLELVRSWAMATPFGDAEQSILVRRGVPGVAENMSWTDRANGDDWPWLADTMTGGLRMQNVLDLVTKVIEAGVPGDYIETGVWRGGNSVYARAILDAFGETSRVSYVCDSFAGLPPGERKLHEGDAGWNVDHDWLSVPAEIVAENFHRVGLLSENVVFAKGFFNETMPQLRLRVKHFSVIRFDGDIYESAVDVLYNLYDKLSLGGYVIVDDWTGFPAADAIRDFFRVHDVPLPKIHEIDRLSAWFQKKMHFEIDYKRYETSNFK
eukprot:TRINITY_DN13255_c0_g2_i1.p1 TRINITY_DN13255_c0_g2~~TRINITY_DN13255_c0_g2_i1.p1  ORF type:complete len:398 (+),score=121.41 TRINITY_DN13255_c0_g2_i1:42-1235(+)